MHTLGIQGITDEVEIGRGGFGVVYRATETDLRRSVAVKMLRGDLDQRAKDRFDRERQAMGSLSGHPNIVTVYRSGYTESGQPYIVMEYLEPGSMDDVVRRNGPLAWRDAAQLGVEIAGVLESAHQAEVLHRDIKPGNILMSTTGQAKLGDFGIARITGSPETTSSLITASIAHAAPEIIDGKRPAAASDVYSLASTLYELVAGQPPFYSPTDESMVPMLARIAKDDIPQQPAMSESFYDVLATAMEKSPADRYDSAEMFGAALMETLEQTGSGPVVFQTTAFSAPPPGRPGTDVDDASAPGRSGQIQPPDVGHGLAHRAAPAPPPVGAGPAPPHAPAPLAGSVPPAGPRVPAGQDLTRLLAFGAAALLVVVVGVFVATRGGDGVGEDPPTSSSIARDTTSTTAAEDDPDVPSSTNVQSPAALPVVSQDDFGVYATVFDATGAIRVDVPTEWADVNNGAGGLAPSLLVSTDVARALTSFDSPGLAIQVVLQPLLDAEIVLDSLSDAECTIVGGGDYNDGAYIGRFRQFNQCGPAGSTVWWVVAAPAENDFSVVVGVQTLNARDESAARRALDTFFIERSAL